MSSRLVRLGLLMGILIGLTVAVASAQSPPAIPAGTPVCNCAGYVGPHYHLNTPAVASTPRLFGRSTNVNNMSNARPTGLSPNEQGLPRGRRYYGGRYFGSFNDRFYGPQYGYF